MEFILLKIRSLNSFVLCISFNDAEMVADFPRQFYEHAEMVADLPRQFYEPCLPFGDLSVLQSGVLPDASPTQSLDIQIIIPNLPSDHLPDVSMVPRVEMQRNRLKRRRVRAPAPVFRANQFVAARERLFAGFVNENLNRLDTLSIELDVFDTHRFAPYISLDRDQDTEEEEENENILVIFFDLIKTKKQFSSEK